MRGAAARRGDPYLSEKPGWMDDKCKYGWLKDRETLDDHREYNSGSGERHHARGGALSGSPPRDAQTHRPKGKNGSGGADLEQKTE